METIEGESVASNNAPDVIDFLIQNYRSHLKEDRDLELFSSFLPQVCPANKMYQMWLPTMGNNPQDGTQYVLTPKGKHFLTDEDLISHRYDPLERHTVSNRQRSLNDSSLHENTTKALKKFPQRSFYTGLLQNPQNYIQSMSLRKAIIFLFYLDFTYDYYLKEEGAYTALAGGPYFDLPSFLSTLNDLLEACQLGTIYMANQYDWLILACVRHLEVAGEEMYFDPKYSNPAEFLDMVLELSYEGEDEES